MTTQKTVTKAAGIMMVLILLSRVFALVREMAIAHWFGQGGATDVYLAAFRIPDIMFYLIAGGVLSSAFVPVFVDHISHNRRKEAWEVFSIVATVLTIVIGSFVILGEIYARPLVGIGAAPGFTPEKLDQVAHLTRIILPAQLFFFMGGLMMASLWAHNQFVSPGLGPSIYNIGIITGCVIAGTKLGPSGIEGLAWGALTGAFIGNFVLQYIVLRRYGLEFHPNLNLRHPEAMRVWRLMIPVIFSLSLPQVDVYFNGVFASHLATGTVSAVDRANRLMQIPIGVFGQAIAIGFYTTLAAQFATDKMQDFKETFNYGLRTIAFVSIPATVMMVVLRVPIIQLIFQGGRFTSFATYKIAGVLIFYALGIFAWSAQALIARAFYAMNQTKVPMWTGTAITAIFIPMSWGLMHWIGYIGLGIATTVAVSLHAGAMLYMLSKRTGGIGAARIMTSVTKISIASGVMGAAMWVSLARVPWHKLPHLPLKVTAGLHFLIPAGVGMLLFVVAVHMLKLEESQAVWGMIKRRVTGRSAAPVIEDSI